MEDLDDWPTLILRQLGESLGFQFGSLGTFLTLLEMEKVEFLVESEASRSRSYRRRPN